MHDCLLKCEWSIRPQDFACKKGVLAMLLVQRKDKQVSGLLFPKACEPSR